MPRADRSAPTALLAVWVALLPATAPAQQAGEWRPAVQEVERLLAGGPWGPADEVVAAEVEGERAGCSPAPPRACGALSLYYSRTSTGLVEEPARAATLYLFACRDSYAWACYLLGEQASHDATPEGADARRAADLYEHACALGESRACMRLGEMFESGAGIAALPERAERLYESECEASRTAGCRGLARVLIDRGHVGERDGWERIQWALDRACSGGSGESCHRLAELIEGENGVDNEVARYFGRACDRNYAPGCYRYAGLLEAGEGVSRPDASFARKLYQQACQGGVEAACERVGSPDR